MEVVLEYTEEVETSFDEAFLQDVAERTLREAAFAFLSEKRISINAIAVAPEKIRELNRQYRDTDKVTDILSFGEYADTGALGEEEGEDVFLGELFFCPDFIGQAAREDMVSLEHEMMYIFSHGVLHLLGFGHSDEMFAIQDRVTEALVAKLRQK